MVRAFSPDGRELWRTRLSEYAQQQCELTRQGTCCTYNIPDPGTGSWHTAVSVGGADGDHLFVTLRENRRLTLEGFREATRVAAATRQPQPAQVEIRYEGRMLDLRTGRELARHPTDAPDGVFQISDGFVYTVIERPVPTVRVYRR